MEIIQYNLNDHFTLPENFQRTYADLPFALFDIETTGLNPRFNKVILIGILYYNKDKLILEQLFCDFQYDEPILLEQFISRIKEIPLLVSYNGDSFDIPFLSKRIEVNKISDNLPNFCSFDLLKFVRSHKSQFDLENCKLKSVEKYLGINREDQITGKDSVDMYNRFEVTKDKFLKDLILLHNHDDLRYLLQVMSILDKVSNGSLIGTVPHILNGSAEETWIINKTNIKGNTLIASGLLLCDSKTDFILHRPGYSIEYSFCNSSYELKVPLYKAVLDSGAKCLYINLDDYSFEYTSEAEVSDSVPRSIILFKKDKDLNCIDIYGFIKHLLPSIFESLLETSN